MRVQITVKQQNASFNKEYAEQYNFGKGSHDNWKDNWSKTIEFSKEFDNVDVSKNTNYELQLDSSDFLNLKNVTVLRCYKLNQEDEVFIISKSIVKRMLKPPTRVNSFTERYYFYLKPNVEILTLSNNIYLNKDEIPHNDFK